MSITFPTFIDKEIVTPEKLNDFVQALEAKFAAGLSSAEIIWPLIAGGDLLMGDESITGGQSIWGIYNADQYTDDWDQCLLDAGSGGCIVIPPNTTVVMDASAMVGTSLTIKGSGPSSILQLEAGATGTYALRNSTSGFSFKLENLTVDGADIGANRGITLQGADDVVIHNVLFKDFPLSSLYLTSTGGVGCSNVQITDNSFEGGSSYQIEGDDVADLVIKGNSFKTASKTAIMLEASGATADMLRLEIEGNNFFGCTGDVISVLGADGNFNAPQSHIRVAGNKANGLNGIKVGSATAKVQYISVTDNIIPNSAGDALVICAQHGIVSDNVAYNANDDGLDLTISEGLVVADNLFVGAGTFAIDYATALGCFIHDNVCGSDAINISTSTATPCHAYGNSDDTPEALPVSSWATTGTKIDFPANTFNVGDVLHVRVAGQDTLSGTNTCALTLNARTIGSVLTHGPTDTFGIVSDVLITSTTEVKYVSFGNHSNAAKPETHAASVNGGIDITSAMTLTLSNNTVNGISVWVNRGVSV